MKFLTIMGTFLIACIVIAHIPTMQADAAQELKWRRHCAYMSAAVALAGSGMCWYYHDTWSAEKPQLSFFIAGSMLCTGIVGSAYNGIKLIKHEYDEKNNCSCDYPPSSWVDKAIAWEITVPGLVLTASFWTFMFAVDANRHRR